LREDFCDVVNGDVAPNSSCAQKRFERKTRSERGRLWREKTGLRGEPARGGPLGDLRSIKQQPSAIGSVRQALAANPIFYDALRNPYKHVWLEAK